MKGVVCVLSVKGGTGKTFCSIRIANELVERGYKVSLIDIDISSPNLLELIGIDEDIELDLATRKFIPIKREGMEILSFYQLSKGHFVCKHGYEHAQIIKDFILNTKWNDNDYWVLDMPAGSSSDDFKVVRELFGEKAMGAIIVTLPNTYMDARRVIELCYANEVNPICGIINMSYLKCDCGKKIKLFGDTGKVSDLFGKYSIPFTLLAYERNLEDMKNNHKEIKFVVDRIEECLKK